MRLLLVLLLAISLGGCGLFSSDDNTLNSSPAPIPEKKSNFSLWPFGGGQSDATGSLEYQRTKSEDQKDSYAFVVRNTHDKRTIEGEIRTTVTSPAQETSVRTTNFTLAPNGAKEILLYPASSRITYEVTAVFKD